MMYTLSKIGFRCFSPDSGRNPHCSDFMILRLTKENAALRERLGNLDLQQRYCGLSFEQMCRLLQKEEIEVEGLGGDTTRAMTERVSFLKEAKPTLLHFLWVHRDILANPYHPALTSEERYFRRLVPFGLVHQEPSSGGLKPVPSVDA
jgi:hypothetical protein